MSVILVNFRFDFDDWIWVQIALGHGASCSKLTTSLVNVYVKIENINITNPLFFFCFVFFFSCFCSFFSLFFGGDVRINAKDSHIFSTNAGFDNVVGIYLTN